MPFVDQAERDDHFVKHGADFGVGTPEDYEALADAFLAGPRGPSTMEYTRSRGDRIRYDTQTDEFGVVSVNGVVRTYFRPVPGVTHRYSTNLEYFNRTCRSF